MASGSGLAAQLVPPRSAVRVIQRPVGRDSPQALPTADCFETVRQEATRRTCPHPAAVVPVLQTRRRRGDDIEGADRVEKVLGVPITVQVLAEQGEPQVPWRRCARRRRVPRGR